jgi:tRNA(fMet)-specific endonuclease VapC
MPSDMRFLLDTDVFSALARQISSKARNRLAELPAGSVALSVITCAEIAFGLERHPVSAGLTARIERLQQVLPILPVEQGVAQHYARTRAELERRGTPIGPNDLWLAAHGLAEQVTVVTGNEREFRRVPGLRVENWLR